MNLKILAFTLSLFTLPIFPQFYDYPRPDEGLFTGGLGINYIDGDPYLRVSLRPEISFEQIGMGLDLNLDFSSSGALRKENFNELTDYLSIIRYVRYGEKNQPVYIKLGQLDYYTLGHGSIIYQYNNSPSYDARAIGLVADLDFNTFGFESIYSTLGRAGLLGLRVYGRPLQFTDLASVPIIGRLELGLSLVADINSNTGIVDGYYDPQFNRFVNLKDNGSITAFGFDLELPLIYTGFTELYLYSDFTKFFDYGSGVALGAQLNINSLDWIKLTAKLERQFNGNHYIPSYFNSLYEIERLSVGKDSLSFKSKVQSLQSATDQSNGFYGSLYARVLELFDVFGSYQRLDDFPTSGILNLRTTIAPEEAPFIARAGYDKINIIDEADLFRLDDRSFLFFEAGYKPYPFLVISLIYNWTFEPIRDVDNKIIDYKPQKRIEPRIYFLYPFTF